MSDSGAIAPKYNPAKVARLILEETSAMHPQCLTAGELSMRISTDPEDGKEAETLARAIDDLKQSLLLKCRDGDETLEPTKAARHAVSLLTEE